jgi:hypothetical protein
MCHKGVALKADSNVRLLRVDRESPPDWHPRNHLWMTVRRRNNLVSGRSHEIARDGASDGVQTRAIARSAPGHPLRNSHLRRCGNARRERRLAHPWQGVAAYGLGPRRSGYQDSSRQCPLVRERAGRFSSTQMNRCHPFSDWRLGPGRWQQRTQTRR